MAKVLSRVLITGASRGLGLEFTRQWVVRGDRVFALARDPDRSKGLSDLAQRNPENLVTVTCDVTSDDSVSKAAKKVTSCTEALDLVVNNAGTYDKSGGGLMSVSLTNIRHDFEVNALGSIRVSRAFLPLLARGSDPRLVHMTSKMGSIEDNSSGGSYAYRMSKAALNMASRTMSFETAEQNIPCVVLHPGWVRTDMGGSAAPLRVAEAVRAMIATIDRLTMKDNGGFVDLYGETVPW